MKEYNYYIWFAIRNENYVFEGKETPLTIHDLKGDKIASELIDEMISRISKDYNCKPENIKLTNISLLCQHNPK